VARVRDPATARESRLLAGLGGPSAWGTIFGDLACRQICWTFLLEPTTCRSKGNLSRAVADGRGPIHTGKGVPASICCLPQRAGVRPSPLVSLQNHLPPSASSPSSAQAGNVARLRRRTAPGASETGYRVLPLHAHNEVGRQSLAGGARTPGRPWPEWSRLRMPAYPRQCDWFKSGRRRSLTFQV